MPALGPEPKCSLIQVRSAFEGLAEGPLGRPVRAASDPNSDIHTFGRDAASQGNPLLLDVLTADRSIKAALATERGHYKVSGDVIVDRYSAEGEQPEVC